MSFFHVILFDVMLSLFLETNKEKERESKGVVRKGWGETKGDTEQMSKNDLF